MIRADVENAILSTFLSANDVGDDLENIYKLNVNIFTTPFRKKVAIKINEVEDDAYGFLSYKIEESCEGTVFAHEYNEMNGQLSLGLLFSKKYHDDLIKEDEVNELC